MIHSCRKFETSTSTRALCFLRYHLTNSSTELSAGVSDLTFFHEDVKVVKISVKAEEELYNVSGMEKTDKNIKDLFIQLNP